MTAVEFLEEELKANLKKVILEGDSEFMESLFEQAKELEEKRMLEFAGIVSVAAVARGTGWSIRDLYNEYK